LDYLKQIRQKLVELYSGGLSRNQKILAGGVLVFFIITIFIWINSRNIPQDKPDPGSGLAGSAVPDSQTKGPANSANLKSEPVENPKPMENGGQIDNPNLDAGGNPVRQIELPPVRRTSIQNENASPGPMDGTIARLKEKYKNSPNYNLITGYLVPLKEIADGRRAWNDWFRQSAIELFGKKQGQEIEAEIKQINGNKEEKISNLRFDTLDEVSAAVKKDTANYIEKVAINGFLDQAKASSDGKYPWTDTMVGAGEYNLEKAWVNQVDARVRPVKEAKARNFQAVHYATMDQLIAAIKEDTKNYEQTAARDMFLDYIRDIYHQHKLTEPDVSSGGDLLDNYHLTELEKFVNN